MTTYKLKPECEEYRREIAYILGYNPLNYTMWDGSFNREQTIEIFKTLKVLDLWFDKVEEPIMVNGHEVEFDGDYCKINRIDNSIGVYHLSTIQTLRSIPPETLQRIIDKLEGK